MVASYYTKCPLKLQLAKIFIEEGPFTMRILKLNAIGRSMIRTLVAISIQRSKLLLNCSCLHDPVSLLTCSANKLSTNASTVWYQILTEGNIDELGFEQKN